MAAQARGDARAAVQPAKPAARPALAPPARIAAPSRSALPSPRQAAPRTSTRQPAFVQPAFAQRGFTAPQAHQPAIRGSRPAAIQRGRQFAAIPYARQPAQPQFGLRHTAMASCVSRGGRQSCTSGVRSVAFRWGGDLAPAAMTQASCPDGTIATMALGHTDVVRCVPL